MKPEISIITPVFNGERYLAEVIDSVLAQEKVRVEHIIVNDGSTDGTLQIAEYYESRYPSRIRVISQINGGEASAVNRGVTESQGQFIMIVNADDPLLENCVSELWQALLLEENAVVAYGDWQMIDSSGEIVKFVQTLPFSKQALIGDWVCIIGPGSIVRKSAFQDLPVRDFRYKNIADYEMWLRLANVGPFVRVPKVLSTWRNHSSGASWGGRGLDIASQYSRLYEDYFGRENIPDDVLRLKGRALAHQRYYGGIQKLYDSRVPGRRMILKSWMCRPIVRYRFPSVQRSLLGSIAVLTYPLSLQVARVLRELGIQFPSFMDDAIKKRYM